MIERFKKPEIKKTLPEDYWFKIGERIFKERGNKIPDAGEIQAQILIKILDLPSGPFSAIELPQTKETKKRDRIIAEYLTNRPGVLIKSRTEKGGEFYFVSFDFRDFYPQGLPERLKEVLPKDTLNYMEVEYKHKEAIEGLASEINPENWEHPIYYFRLPGGIDLILRGYTHNPIWQKIHGPYLKEANKYAKIICIEGGVNRPFGESLDLYWSDLFAQRGDYDRLMKEAVEAGFDGYFTEVDARERGRIWFDEEVIWGRLPEEFFQKYFEYLKNFFPRLMEKIKTPQEVKEVLIKLSTTGRGVPKREKRIYQKGRVYLLFPYLTKEGKTSFEPTFLELGEHLFSDALSAIKLHLIAKLMRDGHLEKGLIVDYIGAGHLNSKIFFLNYPQYGMEVVLRTIHHLVEEKIKEIPEVFKVFQTPDTKEIVRQITKLVFKKPEPPAPGKTTKIGENQRKLLDYSLDFLEIYNISSEEALPSLEEVEKIREKLAKSR